MPPSVLWLRWGMPRRCYDNSGLIESSSTHHHGSIASQPPTACPALQREAMQAPGFLAMIPGVGGRGVLAILMLGRLPPAMGEHLCLVFAQVGALCRGRACCAPKVACVAMKRDTTKRGLRMWPDATSRRVINEPLRGFLDMLLGVPPWRVRLQLRCLQRS